jgi:hypothetical protein
MTVRVPCPTRFIFPYHISSRRPKWAGKTIALGTFATEEADEKCAKAKALTRAWRSTMRPKPTREWVMVELERLGVRVVSGRLGRKTDGEGEEGEIDSQGVVGMTGMPSISQGGHMTNENIVANHVRGVGVGAGNWGNDDLNSLLARRNSALGMSMMDRRGSLELGSMLGLEGDTMMAPHGALSGATGAFDGRGQFGTGQAVRRASSLGLGTLAGGGLPQMGMSVNPNQYVNRSGMTKAMSHETMHSQSFSLS